MNDAEKRDVVAVFTRFPEPGRTKTRMIPALGAQGAARLQEVMTGRTLLMTRIWQAAGRGLVHVRYTGAPRASFERWLGPVAAYRDQGDGDLGARMARTVRDALASGSDKVVLIGCDCPDLDATRLSEAFTALDTHDVVIGPARDGGYYLIGMRGAHTALFEEADWGTATVLEQTRQCAARLGVRVAELGELDDVDEPPDQAVWEKAAGVNEGAGTVSAIIPALNEDAGIARCVDAAGREADAVWVADGGSTDRTRAIAADAGAHVLATPCGRAAQMNEAVWHARGEYLCFCHADTLLPRGYSDEIKRLSHVPNFIAGAFGLRIDAVGVPYRMVEWGVRRRCNWRQLPYGDQALFVRRDTFLRTGGYVCWPIMEDYEWVQRMRGRGRIVTSEQCVHTHARRWAGLGVWRTLWTNQKVLWGYALGASPERMAQWYRRQTPCQ